MIIIRNIFIISVIVIVTGLLLWYVFKENFINDYHNSYCPRENSVYIHPPSWWAPSKYYNKDDWIVTTPDDLKQKELWYY
jgi:hypothetical protein